MVIGGKEFGKQLMLNSYHQTFKRKVAMKKMLCYRKHKNAVLKLITIKYHICMGCQRGQSSYALNPNFAEILYYQKQSMCTNTDLPWC